MPVDDEAPSGRISDPNPKKQNRKHATTRGQYLVFIGLNVVGNVGINHGECHQYQ